MKRTSLRPLAALAVAITFGAAACGDDSPDASNSADTTEASDTTVAPDTTEAPGTTVDAPEPGDEPTVETAAPVLVGLTEDEATEAAEALDWEIRVTNIDGEDQAVTMDLRPNRVNVAVVDGEVTEVLNIG